MGVLLASIIFLLPSLALSHPVVLSNTTLRSALCPVVLPQDPPSGPDLLPPSFNNRHVSPRIINGDLVSRNLQSSLVSLLITTSQGGFTCTGILISSRWVLTAAHCEVDTNTRVGIGAPRRLGLLPQPVYNVEQAYTHPLYSENAMQNDIAVIRLAQPAPTDSRFMLVNANVRNPQPGSFVRTVGYGASLNDQSREPESVTGFLRQVDVPVTTESSCRNAYGQIDYLSQVCAGYQVGGCDSCAGDSGGPLIQYDENDNPVVVGITSFGIACAQANFPGVYVRPGAHLEWIDSVGAQYTVANSTVAVNVGPVAGGGGGAEVEQQGLSTGQIAAIGAGGVGLLFGVVIVGVSVIARWSWRKKEDGQGMEEPQLGRDMNIGGGYSPQEPALADGPQDHQRRPGTVSTEYGGIP